ncbi:hypothetical protein ALC57_17253 [Trachymyrmex cornetzi]|uniref:Uncharacterized protein n=1 Tax=Trachymyrmex cornetzi TaxID=471704 RepID=A0A195DCT7_9HYME|nr:hypothetical protein ALC57_17253 [Trachymyrmex cornetzi]
MINGAERCRDYSASEQFDEGFGLDSGREMCRSGISPGYNWMEGKRGGGSEPAALPSRAH